MAKLPFRITARASGTTFIMVIASVDADEVTSERYPIGSGNRRREVASLWSRDPRLCNGATVNVEDVVTRLEALELEVKNALDERDAEAAMDADVDAEAVGDQAPVKKSQGTQLVELVMAHDGVSLWHTPEGDGYATIPAGGHFENWAIRSRRFRQWASRLFFERTGKVPGGQGSQDAITTLEAYAGYKGTEHSIYVRLAEHDGAIYLDLADSDWRAVKVTRDGWEVVRTPPVKFRRVNGTLPLPVPVTGGTIDALRVFINVGDDTDFVLVVSWLIGAFNPRGPYPVLEFDGEQGSAKSTACRVLRRLIDPNKSDIRCQPRDERDLLIAATNGWVVGLDNLSSIPVWLSDALCRISTGSGFGTRQLFTDGEEILFAGQRPIIVNGIAELATRSDLLDRTLRVTLPSIPEHMRRSEAEFWAVFDTARPALLGALLDAVVTALRRIDLVKLDRLPRMADFALWVVAAEPSLPWRTVAFLAAYMGNREAAHELVLEASSVAGVLRRWFDQNGRAAWTGNSTALLGSLSAIGREIVSQEHWPKSGRGLSGALRRIAPNLRAVGIDVQFGKGRRLTIRSTPQKTVPTGPDRSVPDGSAGSDGCSHDRSTGGDDGNPDQRDRGAIVAGEADGGAATEFPS